MVKIRSMLKTIGRVFAVGLITALPFLITISILYWVVSGVESIAATPFVALVPAKYQFGGMGIAAAVLIIFGIGILIRLIAGQKILDFFERLMSKIPVAKMIYGSTKDIMHLFSRDKKSFNRVVLVTVPGSNYKMVGLVTRDGFEGVEGLGKDMVSVYIPISYQIGGYMMLIPRPELQEAGMSVEEAIRLILTAGVSTQVGGENGNGSGEAPVVGVLAGGRGGVSLPAARLTADKSA
jgi:uncharacterized membrane protein